MMQLQNKIKDAEQVVNSPSGESAEHPKVEQGMALLALTHTPLEHQLYEAMLAKVSAANTRLGTFGTRRLMILTGLTNFSAIQRARDGLLKKLSIERYQTPEDFGALRTKESTYRVFSPDEIFKRRRAAGLEAYPTAIELDAASAAFAQAIERLLKGHNLSRRETQVALYCTKGLTNAEIASKLSIREQTVKFHLRHVYIKFGVRRRAELISRLLM